MKVTFTPVFNRKNYLNDHGKAIIEIIAYQNRKRKYISTGIFILPTEWNYKKQEIDKKHPHADVLNFQIRSMINNLEKSQLEFLIKEKPYSINSVDKHREQAKNVSFIDFVKTEILNNRTLTPKTKISHANMLNKLIEFRPKGTIFFEDIDFTFVDDFMNFLREENYAINTIHKHHKNLKKYIELGIKKGLYDQKNPCKEVKVKSELKKREVLTWDEVKKIEDSDLSKYEDKVSIVRDMFLFSFYTGLRISDATNLKTSYVKKDKEGYALDFLTIKVNKRAEIPLYRLFKSSGSKLSKPEMILEKYFDKKNEFLFPKLSEQYINRHLKLLTSIVNIPLNVTFHTARHSFGTFMASKIPLPQLMFLMQHSDIKTTMVYVNTNQELVKQGLLKVDWE
jgi:integrase